MPPRQIFEIPQFLLPRLTWSTAPAKLKFSSKPIKASVKTSPRPRSPTTHCNFPAQSRSRPFSTASLRITSLVSTSHYEQGRNARNRASSYPQSSPLPEAAVAIRHNGVYVASYKTAKRAFSATAKQNNVHHFDTLKFVQRLRGEGFNEEQSVAMMRVLNDVIEESIQNLTRTMVLKEGTCSS